MSYEEASARESNAFEELQRAATARSRFDARAAVYSDHREPYEAAVERLLAAVQAHEAASRDLMKLRARTA